MNSIAPRLEFLSSESECGRAPFEPWYNPIYMYIDIEMSPRRAGWGTLRWRVDTGQSEVCRQLGEDEGWPADNGVPARRWRTRPASNPQSRSGGLVAGTAANKGMGESAFPPSTPLPPSPGYVPNGLRIPERQVRRGEERGRRVEGECETPDISAYDYTACFAMSDIRRFNNTLLLGVLETRNIGMGKFRRGIFRERIIACAPVYIRVRQIYIWNV